jgi:FO synthase
MTGVIDNIQCSWVKLGLEGARQALRAGCNDLGGTLMNENISRAAGAEHGQGVEEEDLAEVVAPLGRPLEQRTTLYGRVRTIGHRLPPAPTPVTIGSRTPAAR